LWPVWFVIRTTTSLPTCESERSLAARSIALLRAIAASNTASGWPLTAPSG
jgi:hypothetical protein